MGKNLKLSLTIVFIYFSGPNKAVFAVSYENKFLVYNNKSRFLVLFPGTVALFRPKCFPQVWRAKQREVKGIVLGPPGCAQVFRYLSPGPLDFLVV